MVFPSCLRLTLDWANTVSEVWTKIFQSNACPKSVSFAIAHHNGPASQLQRSKSELKIAVFFSLSRLSIVYYFYLRVFTSPHTCTGTLHTHVKGTFSSFLCRLNTQQLGRRRRRKIIRYVAILSTDKQTHSHSATYGHIDDELYCVACWLNNRVKPFEDARAKKKICTLMFE